MTDIAAIAAIIEPEARALGFDLVRVALFGGKSDPTLQVMAERPDTRQLDLADCEALSRRVSEVLDAADPIAEAYRLEVSSPGIDRPLTRPKDYQDWAGFDARIRLASPLDPGSGSGAGPGSGSGAGPGSGSGAGGRKQLDGRLVGLEGEAVKVYVERLGEVAVPLGQIASAKLLLTDALIEATAPLSAAGADEVIEAPSEGADRISEKG